MFHCYDQSGWTKPDTDTQEMKLSELSQMMLEVWHIEPVASNGWSIRSCLVVRLMTGFTPSKGPVEGLHQ